MRGLKHIDDEIIELSYKKNISEDKDLDLEISINYRLDFDEDARICYGNAEIEIDDDEHTQLEIRIHTIGIFSYKADILTDEIRRQLHAETVVELNPHWNSLLTNLTMLAGIPPIELEPMEFEDAEIQLSHGEGLN